MVGLLPLPTFGASPSPRPIVKPACADVMKLDLSDLKEAPTKLETATVVTEGVPAPYCLVSGYAARSVAFQVRLLTEIWSQRMGIWLRRVLQRPALAIRKRPFRLDAASAMRCCGPVPCATDW